MPQLLSGSGCLRSAWFSVLPGKVSLPLEARLDVGREREPQRGVSLALEPCEPGPGGRRPLAGKVASLGRPVYLVPQTACGISEKCDKLSDTSLDKKEEVPGFS